MAEQGGRPRRRPGEFGGRKFTPRRKVCQFCADKIQEVDYKDLGRLRRYLSERGKIEPRRKTGTCAKHQRSLSTALKRARHLALLPFTAEHIRVTGLLIREPGSNPRGPRPPRPMPDGAPSDGATPAPAPAEGATSAPAPTDGAAPAPAPESPEAVAESSAAQGVGSEPVAAGSPAT